MFPFRPAAPQVFLDTLNELLQHCISSGSAFAALFRNVLAAERKRQRQMGAGALAKDPICPLDCRVSP